MARRTPQPTALTGLAQVTLHPLPNSSIRTSQVNVSQESTWLYGCTEPDIDAVAVVIAPQLNLILENRDSSYWGDYYTDRSGQSFELKLYRNLDPMFREGDHPSEYWCEPDFRDCFALLSVDADASTLESFHARIATVLPEFRLLRTFE